jgi:DNA-binding MarR family transcriptional regulator
MVRGVYSRGARLQPRRARLGADLLDDLLKLSDHGSMQTLQTATMGGCTAADCAAEILEAVPAAIRFIREQMRRHRGSDLSVPQFRTLAFIHSHPGVSLSVLSDWLGLSLPATSRLVGGLVRRKFVSRRTPAGDRRVVALSISARGNRTVSAARRATVMGLAAVVAPFSDEERGAVRSALFALRQEFEAVAALGAHATERGSAGRIAAGGKSAAPSRSGAGK